MLRRNIISIQPVLHLVLPEIKKVHNAVLLSMTTMGNGVGFHLVVCPPKQASLLVSQVLVKINNSSSAYNPGNSRSEEACSLGHDTTEGLWWKMVSDSFFEIWLYFQMVL